MPEPSDPVEINTPNQRPLAKNPIDAATAKLKEALAKELAQKVEAQQKKTLASFQVFQNEKKELIRLVADAEYSKKDIDTFLDAIKE